MSKIKAAGLQVDSETGVLGVTNGETSDGEVLRLAVSGLEDGIPGYTAGTGTATVEVPEGARVVAVAVAAQGVADAFVTLDGGAQIKVPEGRDWSWAPRGSWQETTIEITDSESYFVEWVT